MRRVGVAAVLLVIWILLWGELSVGNVVSGVLAAVVVLVVFPGDKPDTTTRYAFYVLPFFKLVAYMVWQLIRSNILLTTEAFSRTARLHTAVIAVDLKTPSPPLITAVANLMALNPSTLAIDIDPPAGVIYVHVFYLGDNLETMRVDVNRLQELIIRAFTVRADQPAEYRATEA